MRKRLGESQNLPSLKVEYGFGSNALGWKYLEGILRGQNDESLNG